MPKHFFITVRTGRNVNVHQLGIHKQNMVYPYNKILLSYEKEQTSDTHNKYNVQKRYASERAQTQKDTFRMVPFIGNVWNRQSHIDRKPIRGC